MFFKVIELLGLAGVVLLLAFFEYLDMWGRLEVIEKRHPRIWRWINLRPVRLVLLLLAIGLLAKDVKDATDLPEVPVIQTKPCTVQTISPTPSERKESKNSLRRRIMRICDELDAFATKRGNLRAQVPDTRDVNGKATELIKFDTETVSRYVGSGLKTRTLGIIREIKSKGLNTGFLEMWAEQAPIQGGTFPNYDTTMPLREFAYHIDPDGNAVRIDY